MGSLPFLFVAGVILFAFFVLSYVAQKARIPSVLAYIFLGLVVANFMTPGGYLQTAAEIGIVLLFFVRGLEFPLSRMLALSKRVSTTGILDIVLNLLGTTLVAILVGFDLISALFIGAVAYATSSSITAKLIEEKKRVANPETEFLLGVLIFEDLLAPVLIVLLAGIKGGNTLTPGLFGALLIKVVLLTGGAILIGTIGFRKLGSFVASHIEKDFMPLLLVGIALAYAGIAIALGFSEVLGAFLAGVMLSETGKSSEISTLLFPLRDATLPFFFFYFGTSLSFSGAVPVLGLTVLVLWGVVGKIITGFLGGRMFGLSPRVSWRAGLSFVQRGEFSAIIAAMAASHLRILGGLYILVTAIIGVTLFQHAPALSRRITKTTVTPTQGT